MRALTRVILLLLVTVLYSHAQTNTPKNSVPSAPTKTPQQILDDNRGSIVSIVSAGKTTEKRGTGFYIQSTGRLVLTNFHVVILSFRSISVSSC